MYEVHLCKDDASYVPLKQISPYARNSVIVSEDSSFWDHKGIDWVEMRKSFETNLEKGRMARGGSTITQQLAKNVYLSSEKSLLRKIREAVIAIRIERRYDKNLILEKYLNVVEFDKDVYGIKSAARHYFDVAPSQLSIAQSAWLAFLLPNPKKYSVSFHKNKLTPFAFKQMREIINRLWRFKRISEEEKKIAIRDARSFFGGLSGESKELEEEFDRGGGDDSGADELSEDLVTEEASPTSTPRLETTVRSETPEPIGTAEPDEAVPEVQPTSE
jgi:monofunctional glycosyltransferase